jgi:hypothetical protein
VAAMAAPPIPQQMAKPTIVHSILICGSSDSNYNWSGPLGRLLADETRRARGGSYRRRMPY